ncbi:MAG: alpha-L-arabinofuranosidase C-terminal domain-containing protein, partial [Bryobacteraceae bacterium]
SGTFDYLSTHFVVTTSRAKEANPTPEFLAKASFALPVELGRRLRAMQRQIDGFPAFAGKTHIAFTEWLFAGRNGSSLPSPSYNNMGGAIDAAGFFNMLMRNADVAPVSDMTGIVEFAGIWKKRGRAYGAPSYYAFRMYSNADATRPVEVDTQAGTYDVHNGITRLPEISGVSYLDVVAALNDASNKLTLFCVNRRLNRDIDAEISLDNFTPRDIARVNTLEAGSIYDTNSETRPEAVTPTESTFPVKGAKFSYRFPPSSVTVIELKK